nr:uncharacterized protein LOC129269995 [Lytechinus pictus]
MTTPEAPWSASRNCENLPATAAIIMLTCRSRGWVGGEGVASGIRIRRTNRAGILPVWPLPLRDAMAVRSLDSPETTAVTVTAHSAGPGLGLDQEVPDVTGPPLHIPVGETGDTESKNI